MRGSIRGVILAALAVCAFGALTVGQASAAVIGRPLNTAFLAIYGNPGSNGTGAVPVGGGLARNFGFGENMLFEATKGKTNQVALEIEFPAIKDIFRVEESFIGGTLMSNKTGIGNPVGLTVQFVDFQHNFAGEPTKEVLTPVYADTSDRPWLVNICPLKEAGTECRIDPLISEANELPRTVKIEDVSFDIGPTAAASGIVVQGTVWGRWENGKAGVPPCIELLNPATAAGANQGLNVTQPVALLGQKAPIVKGRVCLISANNDWYSSSIAFEPEITIKNTE